MGKFKFVCLEVVLPGMDGYQVCRDIKHDSYASGKPPVVVMFSSRGANTDKNSGMSGRIRCLADQTIDQSKMLMVLSKYDEQIERSFRRTNVGGSGLSCAL